MKYGPHTFVPAWVSALRWFYKYLRYEDVGIAALT